MIKFFKNISFTIKNFLLKYFSKKYQHLTPVWLKELPDSLDKNNIYILGEKEYLWYAVMLCPCGCGEKIHTSLLKDDNPHWTLTKHEDGNVTLSPSVWRTKGCKSHFFLRNGNIEWVNKNY